MSLLMDALRKAEADKKQGLASEETKSALTSDEQGATGTNFEPAVADDSDPSINVSFAETVDLARTSRERRRVPEPAPELTLEPLTYSDPLELELGDDSDESPPPPAAGETPTSTMPSTRGVEHATEKHFDESSDEPPAPDTTAGNETDPLDAMMAVPAVNRESGITETVATANTVFEAGASGPSRRVIGWGIVGALLTGVLLLGAGFYYFQQAPTTQTLPSPLVAADVEKSEPRELPVVDIEAEAAAEPARVALIDAEPAAPEPTADIEIDTADTAADAPGDDSPGPGPGPSPDDDEPAPVVAMVEPASPVSPPAAFRLDDVRIARSTTRTRTEPLLNEAYALYVAGDYEASERAYAAVLEAWPERRDALLGMAALKLRKGEVAEAHAMYRDVLRRDPGNATAQAALFSLERGAAGDVTESRLKMLLDEGVDSGYVYFSLGNLYARNGRWADAQQAYFEALRHHPTNPDYHYNLAVSLDRIGQRAAAVKYYQSAVDHTDKEAAGFDPAQALARLQAIAGAGAQ